VSNWVIQNNYITNTTSKGISCGGKGNQILHNYVSYQADIYTSNGDTIISGNLYLLEDADGDGLLGIQELTLGTNPYLIDSDNDNFLDGYEYKMGTNPNDPLSYPLLSQNEYNAMYAMLQGNATLINIIFGFLSGNWTYLQSMRTALLQNISQIEAVLYILDDTLSDRDCDGLPDLYEIGNGTNPLQIDTDFDMLSDAFELKIGTDPLKNDTDGDGYLDGVEVNNLTDPRDAKDYPGKPEPVVPTEPSEPTTPTIPLLIGLSLGLGVVSVISVVFGIKSRKPFWSRLR
jgi:hypothetical protein